MSNGLELFNMSLLFRVVTEIWFKKFQGSFLQNSDF